LDTEFGSEKIKGLIADAAMKAAQSQTKEMMESTLKPAVDDARAQIKQQSDQVKQFSEQVRKESEQRISQLQGAITAERDQEKRSLNSLRDEYSRQLDQLRPLVDFQEKLKQIELLKGSAMDGDSSAFSELVNYSSQDKDLAAVVRASTMEVKLLYATGSRTGGMSIWIVNPDGSKGAEDEKIPSSSLMSVFLFAAPQWEHRVRAAEILGTRRESGVAEALLRAMQTDQNLWVRRAALRSFEGLTGFQEHDTFDFDKAADWWQKNKSDYLKNLPK
jgi:hypothetical protein